MRHQLARNSRWVLLVVTLTLVGGLVGATRTGAQEPNANQPYGFIDQERGTYMLVRLDADHREVGEFSFAVPGVGLFWGEANATIEAKSDSAVLARYEGPGGLNRGARLDPVFARWTQPAGGDEAVTIRLTARINPRRQTASAELWHEGRMYKLNSKEPPRTADAIFAAIAGATAQRDWRRLYGYADRDFQSLLTEAEFGAWIDESFALVGTVIDARVVSTPVYRSYRAGYHTAAAKIAVTLAAEGANTTLTSTVALVLDGGDWKFMTLDAGS